MTESRVCEFKEHQEIMLAWRDKRCTGRTTRMLHKAVIHALAGRRVVVLGTNAAIANGWKRVVAYIAKKCGVTIPRGSITFDSARADLRRYADASPPYVILRDHAVTGDEDA